MEARPSRRVIITGGASGIGRATAVLLARRGARVMALDVDDAAGASLATEAASSPAGPAPAPGATAGAGPTATPGDLAYRHADVADEAQVRDAVADAVARWGGLDALVCAAGIMRGQGQDLRAFPESTFDQVLDVNLKGAFLAAKHAAGPMLDASRGVIVLIASRGGVTGGSGSYAYGASKGGMHGLALTLERHLGPKGIRVHDVCPGDVDTPLYRRSLDEALRNGADPAWVEAQLARLTPPAQVAEVLAFLVSDAAAGMRGTVHTA